VNVCDLGNGIELRMDGVTYRFDPRRVMEGDANIVSHAHSDHMPTRFGGNPVVCTPLTGDLARLRRKAVEVEEREEVSLLPAGHVPGSAMALVEGSSSVLYTGDFCTREKNHVRPARPRKCDALIVESTYGRPGYDFPPHDETISSVRDWLENVLNEGLAAVLLAYPIGKAQELSYELRDTDPLLQPTIAGNNAVIASHGLDVCVEPRGEELPGPPFVYITSGMGREKEIVDGLLRKGAKAATFSGWNMNNRFSTRPREHHETFPLSDHCGYNELLEFVRRCSPVSVYTTHGSADALARSIRRELGIDACALIRGQRSLDCFRA
jgi:putative mRNA 3-end processing factor